MTAEKRAVLEWIPVSPDMTPDELRAAIARLDIPQAAIDRLARAIAKAAQDEAQQTDDVA